MGNKCCCENQQDTSVVVDNAAPKYAGLGEDSPEEQMIALALPMHTKPDKIEEEQMPIEIKPDKIEAESTAAESTSPKSPKNVKEELIQSPPKKKHAQAEARSFIKELIKGMDVVLLATSAASKEVRHSSGRFSLSPDTKTLSIGTEIENVVCSVAKLAGVYQVEENRSAFPEKVLDSVTLDQHDRLLMVAYHAESGEKSAFFMMSPTADARSRFCHSLPTLTAHWQQGPEGKAADSVGGDGADSKTLLKKP